MEAAAHMQVRRPCFAGYPACATITSVSYLPVSSSCVLSSCVMFKNDLKMLRPGTIKKIIISRDATPPPRIINKSRRENAAARILPLFLCRDLPRGPHSRKKTFSKKRPSPKPTSFQKVELIMGPSPFHKDENDRKWIL